MSTYTSILAGSILSLFFLMTLVKGLSILFTFSKNKFLDSFIFCIIFLERGERREKERKRNINVWLPFMCPSMGT